MNSESDNYYLNSYQLVTNTGLIGFVASITHYSLENKPFTFRNPKVENEDILEVGAGHGQHIKYVKDNFNSYTMTDIRPELLRTINSEDSRIYIEKLPVNAEELPYQDDSFDRVIATCLLIHLRNPEKALREWQRVCKPNGVITIYVPCESGLFLRSLQAITTRRKQEKLGLNARYLHYQEHSYSYPYILSLLEEVFKGKFQIRKFPFLIGSFDFNLWSVATVKNSK